MLSMNGGAGNLQRTGQRGCDTADVRTVAQARSVFLNDFRGTFEPWLELPLEQAGLGSTKMLLHRGAKTLTCSRHLWLESQNGIIYVKNITKCLANGDLDDGDT
jgi:ABC-type Zn uptake system ZnuABC Zn-binding protein ZnuA